MGEHGSCCTPGEKRCSCPESAAEFARISSGSTDEMVRIEGGRFQMGTDDPVGFPADGEGPVRDVTVDSFWIDETSVTNEAFGRFVDATGYQTDAEKFGWSYVFHLFLDRSLKGRLMMMGRRLQGLEWWYAVDGAGWRCPEGPGSSIVDRMDHPTVHVSWRDAQAYCKWIFDRWSPAFHVDGPRGGSCLCHDSYCSRYRVAVRTSNSPDSSTGNTGFRCVRDV